MPDNAQPSAGIITKHSRQSVVQLKVLVWEDGNGAVSVSFNSPAFLAERHHIEGSLRAPFEAVESIVEAVLGP